MKNRTVIQIDAGYTRNGNSRRAAAIYDLDTSGGLRFYDAVELGAEGSGALQREYPDLTWALSIAPIFKVSPTAYRDTLKAAEKKRFQRDLEG